jgi:hypothetical protein
LRVDAARAALLDAIVKHGSIAGACRAVGLARASVYRWRRDDQDFDQRVREAEETAIDMLESQLYKHAIKRSTRALIFFLRKRRPEVYGDNLRCPHCGLRPKERTKTIETVPVSVNVDRPAPSTLAHGRAGSMVESGQNTSGDHAAERPGKGAQFLERLREAIGKMPDVPEVHEG